MKLYHGTNIDFGVIDLAKSNKYKDFGQGFYLTDIRSQAEEMPTSSTIMISLLVLLQMMGLLTFWVVMRKEL